MTIAYVPPDSITTEAAYSTDEPAPSIDTAARGSRWRQFLSLVRDITTTPGEAADANEWIEKTLPLLQRVIDMPENWDGEGSPRPDAGPIEATRLLLIRLQDSALGPVPVPFVCAIAGGGVQLEWTSSGKHLEMEFVDAETIVFLKQEGGLVQSGEFPAHDAEATRRLLDWFTSF